MLALPEVFPSAYLRFLPKRSGIRSLQYRLFLLSPSACIPAVCVKTYSPMIDLLAGILTPENVSTSLLTLYMEASSIDVSLPGLNALINDNALAFYAFPSLYHI